MVFSAVSKTEYPFNDLSKTFKWFYYPFTKIAYPFNDLGKAFLKKLICMRLTIWAKRLTQFHIRYPWFSYPLTGIIRLNGVFCIREKYRKIKALVKTFDI